MKRRTRHPRVSSSRGRPSSGPNHLTLHILALSLIVTGCAAGPPLRPPTDTALDSLGIAPDAGAPKLDPPALLIERSVRLRYTTAEQARLGGASLDQVLGAFERPDYLPPAGAPIAPPVPDRDPPAAALRAYVRGRDAYRNGDRFEAINQLEQARRLDPASPTIVRLLGEVYISRGDQVRGARSLEQAARLDPTDPGVLFLLGRHAYGRGEMPKAIATLAYARDLLAHSPRLLTDDPTLDPAIGFLMPYYLGLALLRSGHDSAAAEVLTGILDAPFDTHRTSELLREVAMLNRRRDDLRIMVGDAMMRLGRRDLAIAQYEGAVDPLDPEEAALYTARHVYALLLLDRPAEAESLLIERLQTAASAPMLGLAAYVADNSTDRPALLERLRLLYEQQGRPAALALAYAELLPADEAVAFLRAHLQNRPDDLPTYRATLDRMRDRPIDELVDTALTLMRANAAAASQVAAGLLDEDLEIDRDALLGAVDAELAQRPGDAARLYLRGAVLQALGRANEAADAFDAALTADESFVGSRVAVIELHIEGGRFDRALALIEQTPEPLALQLRFARVRALTGLERYAEAERHLRALLAEMPRDPTYLVHLAVLQTAQDNAQQAEATLLSILDFDPTYEPAYAALFELYDSDPRRFTDASRQRLLQRARQAIPTSRTTRLHLAIWAIRARRDNQAEPLLRAILEQDLADEQAAELLIDLLRRTGRPEQAATMLPRLIDAQPDNLRLLVVYGVIANGMPEAERARHIELITRLMGEYAERQPPEFATWITVSEMYRLIGLYNEAGDAMLRAMALDEQRASELRGDLDAMGLITFLLIRADRHDDALGQIDIAVRQHPELTADLHYLRGSIYHGLDRMDDYIAALNDALAADPDHPGANNDLGYLWAEQDINLPQALEMARKAVNAEPKNAAYLDTLGWTLYKLGRFDEAVAHLEDARLNLRGDDPVILDHLGDALWRLNRNQEAILVWQTAQQRAAAREPAALIADDSLLETLQQKLRDARAERRPPIAPIPADADDTTARVVPGAPAPDPAPAAP